MFSDELTVTGKQQLPRIGQLVRYPDGENGVIRNVTLKHVHVFVGNGESLVPIRDLKPSGDSGIWEFGWSREEAQ